VREARGREAAPSEVIGGRGCRRGHARKDGRGLDRERGANGREARRKGTAKDVSNLGVSVEKRRTEREGIVDRRTTGRAL
jgi:hypothetical protein